MPWVIALVAVKLWAPRTDKRPMSDLRGIITEQDADIIMSYHRDEYYTKEACKELGVAEVIISSNVTDPQEPSNWYYQLDHEI
jgi:replicative DNA helicase